MAAKDLLNSNQAKNSKPSANMNLGEQVNKDHQKTNKPCKNSLPT
ncbi:hypothetical protein [Sporomusa aerivorans]